MDMEELEILVANLISDAEYEGASGTPESLEAEENSRLALLDFIRRAQ